MNVKFFKSVIALNLDDFVLFRLNDWKKKDFSSRDS